MRLIDAEALARTMYHKAFEIDDGRSRWDSGLWIRYKIFEEALEEQKTVEAEPVCLCKECLRFERNHWETVNGIPLIVGEATATFRAGNTAQGSRVPNISGTQDRTTSAHWQNRPCHSRKPGCLKRIVAGR